MICGKIAQVAAHGCLLAAAGLSPCMGQAAAPPAGKQEKQVTPVAVRVSTDKKVYAAGEPIKLTLTAKNAGKEAVQITFSSGQRFDFEIRRGAKPDGPSVWQWSRNRMFTMMIATETLAAGKTQTFGATFAPGAARAGNGAESKPGKTGPLTPGTYTVVGTLTVMDRAARPQGTATFRVK